LGHADSPIRRSIPSSPACGPASPTAPVSALRSPIPRPVAAETPRSPRPYPVAQSSAWLRSLPASCHRCPPSSPSAALSPPVTPVPTGIPLDAFQPLVERMCHRPRPLRVGNPKLFLRLPLLRSSSHRHARSLRTSALDYARNFTSESRLSPRTARCGCSFLWVV